MPPPLGGGQNQGSSGFLLYGARFLLTLVASAITIRATSGLA
jgi:hypothetical protein